MLDLGAARLLEPFTRTKKSRRKGRWCWPWSIQKRYGFSPTVSFYARGCFSPFRGAGGRPSKVGPFDVVMSDMAPATTGIKMTDQARSSILLLAAYQIPRWPISARGGSLWSEIFMGPDTGNLARADAQILCQRRKDPENRKARARRARRTFWRRRGLHKAPAFAIICLSAAQPAGRP